MNYKDHLWVAIRRHFGPDRQFMTRDQIGRAMGMRKPSIAELIDAGFSQDDQRRFIIPA